MKPKIPFMPIHQPSDSPSEDTMATLEEMRSNFAAERAAAVALSTSTASSVVGEPKDWATNQPKSRDVLIIGTPNGTYDDENVQRLIQGAKDSGQSYVILDSGGTSNSVAAVQTVEGFKSQVLPEPKLTEEKINKLFSKHRPRILTQAEQLEADRIRERNEWNAKVDERKATKKQRKYIRDVTQYKDPPALTGGNRIGKATLLKLQTENLNIPKK